MKKFCESIIEHAIEIINFGKAKMIPLIKEQQELLEKSKIHYICQKSSNKSDNHILKSRIYEQCKIYTKLIIKPYKCLAEGIHKIRCKYEHDEKICQICGIKCFLNTQM